MKYSEIRNQLKTGDIAIFSGNGLISKVIKIYTKSEWSHVGMIICVDDLDLVLLAESTTLSDIEDLRTGKMHEGVQLVPLSERIKGYDGYAGIRQIKTPLTPDERLNLIQFYRETHGRPYEKSKLELIKSAYDGNRGLNVEDFSSIFCSEWVVGAYQKMGLMDLETSANEYTPKNLADADFDFMYKPNTIIGIDK